MRYNITMAATPEKKVKEKCIKLFKQYGVYYFYAIATGMGRSGIPDLICCVNGRFLAVECKAGKGKTTALQDKELAAVRTAMGVAVVINEDNLDMLESLIKEMSNE